jgi:hypothetical protein
MSQPPYLPPNRMPGAQQRETGRPINRGDSGPRWPLMAGTAFGTAIVTAIISILIALQFWSPQTVALQITALAAATMTAEYTPPPTFTPIPPDADQDTVLDEADNCRTNANAEQTDLDNDGIGDACDDDSDGDTIPNTGDNCPLMAGVSSVDTDSDNQGDACDADDDQDRIEDERDNCPILANSGQEDMDGDGLGDGCDVSFDLQGIQINLSARQPLYLGQAENEIPLEIDYTGSTEAAEGGQIQILTSAGTLHPDQQTCADPAGDVLTLPSLPARLIYCPPGTQPQGDLTITAREIDDTGKSIGSGGFLAVSTIQETVTAVFDMGHPLNITEETDPTLLNHCTLSTPIDDLNLEQAAIPVLFTLQTDPNTETGRTYPVTLGIPPGRAYWVDRRTCQLLGDGPLADDTTIAADINEGYTLYYVPDPEASNTTLRATVAGQSFAYNIPPVLVATKRINFRNTAGTLVSRIEEGGRALILGVGSEGWIQVQLDNEERELWVNLDQNTESYTLLGSLSSAPAVQTPNFP